MPKGPIEIAPRQLNLREDPVALTFVFVELQPFLGCGLALVHQRRNVIEPEHDRQPESAGKPCVSNREAWIALDGAFEHFDAQAGIFRRIPVMMILAAKNQVVRVKPFSRCAARMAQSSCLNPARQCRHECRRNLVLEREHVTHFPIVALPPDLQACARIHELHVDAHALFEALHAALIEHQVIFLRDQPALTPDLQIELGRRFGPLHEHPAAPHLEGHPEVFVIHTHEGSRIANGNGWHTDVSCDERPPLATLLQLHVLPACGGDTLFASAYAAYESLSQRMRELLCNLTATHASEHVYRGRYAERGVDDTGRTYPSAVHPVVRTHPECGRRALYVNRAFTTRINELTAKESDALLSFLWKHLERPEFQLRFRWSKNAIAIWDNRCTQHFAMWDYWPDERKGHRVTVEGERPYFDPEAALPETATHTRVSQRF